MHAGHAMLGAGCSGSSQAQYPSVLSAQTALTAGGPSLSHAARAQVDLGQATNVLDRWIAAASRSLTAFVRAEMGAYRLYTVVPVLVAFIESLTNIYVRYNRGRLKGRGGRADCALALASLFDVLLTVCKVRCHDWGIHACAASLLHARICMLRPGPGVPFYVILRRGSRGFEAGFSVWDPSRRAAVGAALH